MKNFSSVFVIAAAGGLLGIAGIASSQTAAPAAVAATAVSTQLSPSQASQRFRQGERLERKRDMRGAVDAYTAAAEAGDGHAQKKLGDLYSTGNRVLERDYETALKWYHKAREQGIEIPKPFNYPATPAASIPR